MTSETEQDRAERIVRIKRQIAAGTYETPDRIEAAVEAMLTDGQFTGEAEPGRKETGERQGLRRPR